MKLVWRKWSGWDIYYRLINYVMNTAHRLTHITIFRFFKIIILFYFFRWIFIFVQLKIIIYTHNSFKHINTACRTMKNERKINEKMEKYKNRVFEREIKTDKSNFKKWNVLSNFLSWLCMWLRQTGKMYFLIFRSKIYNNTSITVIAPNALKL